MKKFVGFILLVVMTLSMTAIVFADIPEQVWECDWYSSMWAFFGEEDNAEELIAERLRLHGGTPPTLTILPWLPMCENYMRETIAFHEQNVARGIVDEYGAAYSQRLRNAIELGEAVYIATTHPCLYGHMIDSVALAEFQNSMVSLEHELEPLSNERPFSTRFVAITGFSWASGADWRLTNIQNATTRVDSIAILHCWLNPLQPIDRRPWNGTLNPRWISGDTRWIELWGRNWQMSTIELITTSGGQSDSGFFGILPPR